MTTRHPAQGEMDAAEFMAAEVLKWPEKKLQAEIIKFAVGSKREPSPLRWRAYHSFFSDRSQAGWPDLALVRERIVFAELKVTTGKVTPAQEEWHAALLAAGAELYVWRPQDWLDGVIQDVLTRRAR